MILRFDDLKRAMIRSIALMACAVIIAYAAIMLCLGMMPLSPYLLAPIFLGAVVGNFIFNRYEAKALVKIAELVNLYENEDNPQAFVDEMDPLLSTFKPPLNITETWVLAALGRAFVEVGRDDEARGILRGLEKNAASTTHREAVGSMMVNYEPLVVMLEGCQEGIEVLEEAKRAIEEIPELRKKHRHEDLFNNPDMQSRLKYIEVESGFLRCILKGDIDALKESQKQICLEPNASQVLKSRYAAALAQAYLSAGNKREAKVYLEKTLHFGKSLKSSAWAREQLRNLA